MPFRVLFVCTGNVCRSPTAELVFRNLATQHVTSTSAGLAAHSGDRIDPATAAALTDLGLHPATHRARPLTATLAHSADLVLAAETAQRDRIMVDTPAVFRRTFTLKEFVRAAAATELPDSAVLDPTNIVRIVSGNRGAAQSSDPSINDIADPFGASGELASKTVRAIAEQIAALVKLLHIERTRPRPRPYARPRRHAGGDYL